MATDREPVDNKVIKSNAGCVEGDLTRGAKELIHPGESVFVDMEVACRQTLCRESESALLNRRGVRFLSQRNCADNRRRSEQCFLEISHVLSLIPERMLRQSSAPP